MNSQLRKNTIFFYYLAHVTTTIRNAAVTIMKYINSTYHKWERQESNTLLNIKVDLKEEPTVPYLVPVQSPEIA